MREGRRRRDRGRKDREKDQASERGRSVVLVQVNKRWKVKEKRREGEGRGEDGITLYCSSISTTLFCCCVADVCSLMAISSNNAFRFSANYIQTKKGVHTG